MTTEVSRRSFLKSAGLAAISVVAGKLGPQRAASHRLVAQEVTHWDGSPFGRVLQDVMTIYTEPAWGSAPTRQYYTWNDVIPVIAAVVGDGLYATNDTWLQTDQGYVYSSWVQPVNDLPNNPVAPIGEGGVWAVVTVPCTWSRTGPDDGHTRRHRMYYNTVHRLIGVENGYYLAEETYGARYWLKAAHLRVISPEELAPISEHVPPEDKHIEVSIAEQMLYAFEGDQVVFTARVSTGVSKTPTPLGEFRVHLKRHGHRMIGGQGEDFYNLPAIPWISYFSQAFAALHGTYWHNDYGRRHSAGCVNLHPEAARWLFRWTTPAANYWDFGTSADPLQGVVGTRVVVRW